MPSSENNNAVDGGLMLLAPLEVDASNASEGSLTERRATGHGGIGTRVDGVEGNSLVAGAESPPIARPMSTSDLDPVRIVVGLSPINDKNCSLCIALTASC